MEEKKGSGTKVVLYLVLGGLALVCLCGLLFAAIAGIVFGAIRSSEPYEHGMQQALNHPAVIEALGEPIEAGLLINGSIETTSGTGMADLTIPLSGPKGDGTLIIVAQMSGGKWSYELLEVDIVGQGARINLLGGR